MNEGADPPNEGQAVIEADQALDDIASRARRQICRCLEGLAQSMSGVGCRPPAFLPQEQQL